MNPTIIEFFSIWEDLDNSLHVRNYFKERDRQDLRIKDVIVNFQPKGERVEARMEVNYADPQGNLTNEDLTIMLELNGDKWKVTGVKETKF